MITIMTTKDDDKGDEQNAQKIKEQLKWIKDQSKNNTSESRTRQEFKIRIKKNSRLKKKAYNQDSRFKISRIKIKIQDSRFKNEEKTQSR